MTVCNMIPTEVDCVWWSKESPDTPEGTVGVGESTLVKMET